MSIGSIALPIAAFVGDQRIDIATLDVPITLGPIRKVGDHVEYRVTIDTDNLTDQLRAALGEDVALDVVGEITED